MKRFLAVLAVIIPALSFAQIRSQSEAVTLWASGVVPENATTVTPVLNLAGIRELEVLVDNTSGTSLRSLSATLFLPDGVTTIDSTLVKQLGYGTAPAGGYFDPGRERIYIGPNPPGGASIDSTLLSSTSPTTTAMDVTLWTEACDNVAAITVSAGGNTTLSGKIVHDAGTAWTAVGGGTASPNNMFILGPGSTNGAAGSGGSCGAPVPRRLEVISTAPSSGTTLMTVKCRGRVPGTSSIQMVLPQRAKFSIGAGTGTIRAWFIGRP